MIKDAVAQEKDVRFDRCHLKALNTSSVDFEVVYFVTTSDYTRYMDIQQAINLALLRTFSRHGIEFAYPTQVAIQKTIAASARETVAGAEGTPQTRRDPNPS